MSERKPPPKKLPVLPALGKPSPAAAQRELAARPIRAGSRPEFPTRAQAYRAAGLGSASLLVAGLASAAPPPNPPAQPPAQVAAYSEQGSVDGQPLPAARPKFKVWREGGGIGPSEDMWNPKDVEAFVTWTLAREGTLAIQSNYKLDVDGTAVKLDGFDPARNIGYIYTDRMNPAMGAADRAKLDAWIKDGKLAVLFLDLQRAPDPATLQGKVIKFLTVTAKAPPQGSRLPVPAAPPPGAKPAKKK